MNARGRRLIVLALIGQSALLGGCSSHSSQAAHGTPSQLQVRPLIAPAVQYQPSATHSTTPLSGLGFPLPTSESEYERLTSAQQDDLQHRLSAFDCSKSTSGTAPNTASAIANPVLACDSVRSPGQVLLLGPALLTNADVERAEATNDSVVGTWQVNLALKPAGSTSWSNYTTAHHAEPSSQADMTTCSLATVPCADFTAFTVDSVTISAPFIAAPITGGVTVISGQFTQQSATELARSLS